MTLYTYFLISLLTPHTQEIVYILVFDYMYRTSMIKQLWSWLVHIHQLFWGMCWFVIRLLGVWSLVYIYSECSLSFLHFCDICVLILCASDGYMTCRESMEGYIVNMIIHYLSYTLFDNLAWGLFHHPATAKKVTMTVWLVFVQSFLQNCHIWTYHSPIHILCILLLSLEPNFLLNSVNWFHCGMQSNTYQFILFLLLFVVHLFKLVCMENPDYS